MPYSRIKVGDGKGQVRAFAFEKDGARWVVFWHGSGECSLKLPLRTEDVALFDGYAGRPVEIASADGETVLPAGPRRYLRTSLSHEVVRRAFEGAAAFQAH